MKNNDNIQETENKPKEIKGTVASLRLDSVASLGFGISRNKISGFIKAGRLDLNGETVIDIKKTVSEGDTMSLKRKGTIVLENVGGTSRKGRVKIKLEKFI